MSEKLTNILWMAEELGFDVPPHRTEEARSVITRFLEITANPALSHWVY